MKISICNKCKGINFEEIFLILKERYPEAIYQIGCNNMCGIGRDKAVIILNDRPIIASTTEELMNKIKQAII